MSTATRTDWSQYDYCDDCPAIPGEPCTHITTNDVLTRPHARRPKLEDPS
jgi:hypothetical protein